MIKKSSFFVQNEFFKIYFTHFAFCSKKFKFLLKTAARKSFIIGFFLFKNLFILPSPSPHFLNNLLIL